MKTIKDYLFLVFVLLFIIMTCSLGVMINKGLEQKAEIERHASNMLSLNQNVQYLTLTNGELNTLVIQSDKRIHRTDSILLSRDIRIKQLEKLHVTTVTIQNTDTIYLINTDTLFVRDSTGVELYKTPFIDKRNCLNIEGFVMSTDKYPSVAITSQHAEIETYQMEVHRRWYQFWKPRTWTETYTKCGDLKILDVKIKK